ncbi:response regulator [Paenibacillus oralis]|uniref:Response regulator n=1 Tax=Paenibacillus oralis TaxID=2490856 RepID=A0A3P3U4L7_9BACL|nr:response regulator [Paenibacillus oralis]RRJ64599.1 response regulator [Paenibacillus oralis]
MTYQILLVDDEIVAIEGIQAILDLAKLNVSRLFTALNIRQAKEVFESESIDILLCDIEMPQGNGLKLLAWVREHHPYTATIFLTSHADFKYAKEALRLGSLDYLLKPVLAGELEAAIHKAREIIEQHDESHRNRQSHRLWMKHHSLIIERFWLDLINGNTPGNKAAVRGQMEHDQIPLTDESIVLPVLISVKSWNQHLQHRDEKILEYALKKTAAEMMMDNQAYGIVLQLEREQLLALYISEGQKKWDYEQLHDVCRKYIDFCSRHFYCVLTCYVASPVEVHRIADKVAFLKAQNRDNVAFVNQVFGEEGPFADKESIILPDLSIWLSYLKKGTKEDVILAVENFLNRLVKQRLLDANVLHQIHQDFMQALYLFLNHNEIQAHQLFGDEESRRLTGMAGRSVKDMIDWVTHALGKALHQAEVVKQSDSVVQIIKRYVATHIDQELSRDILAEQVFLNPDHLTRIFKKETGYSISEYVIMERLKLAKELLAQTDIPIGAVAAAVGISNFSYFTKLFKKYTHYGPSEYRSQHVVKVSRPKL